MRVQQIGAFLGAQLRKAFVPRKALVADSSGATAVEFAMIGGPFFLILCAIFESAFLVFNQGNLEYATYEASRQLLTGSIQTSGATNANQYSNFTNIICSRLWANFTCANVLVDVQAVTDFNSSINVSKDIFATGATNGFSPGVTGNIVVVRVGYKYPLYFNKYSGFGSGGTANIMSVTVFKAENY